MQIMKGVLKKLSGELNDPINYHFNVNEENFFLNPLLGKKIRLSFTGKIFCIQCGRRTNKSFQQGYCYPCLVKLQECNLCTIHPERCLVMSEKGCPHDDWAHQQCNQKHIVYLANSSGLKVGITREKSRLHRWIDQGAMQGLTIFNVSNRYYAGVIEVALKAYFSDRTDWRRLLSREAEWVDLENQRDQLPILAKNIFDQYGKEIESEDIVFLKNEKVAALTYPILQYPKKINSLSLDKNTVVESSLLGIKGQYFILEDGVINIRKFGGYEVEFYSE